MATALITGANRGIGFELARGYCARGDSVLACCRNPATANALADLAESNAHVEVHALDLAKPATISKLASTLTGRSIDVLINNAGIQGPAMGEQSLAKMVGVDIALNDAWSLNFDLRYIDTSSDVEVEGIDVGSVKIDPWVFGINVGYTF